MLPPFQRLPSAANIAAIAFFVALSGATASAAKPAQAWSVRYEPPRVVNGSPVIFRVTTPKPTRTLSGTWIGHRFDFTYDAKQNLWFALAGASLETKPGQYALELSAETVGGTSISYDKKIPVKNQRYPRVVLKVPGRYTAPSTEDQRQIAEDKKTKEEAFKTVTPERQWHAAFAAPVEAQISDVFGVQRVFNGTVQSSHQGLDFRVGTGTPIAAVNRGKVLLARPLFFEGNCVVIDHGQGLLTLYLHMSKFAVKEGDAVEKGQQLGLSGGTGRATGPHLHLAVRWQGVYLNPQTLLSLRMP